MIPYLQQLVADLPSLRKELEERVPQIETHASFCVYDMKSDNGIEAHLGDINSLNLISKVIHKLGKQPTSIRAFRITIEKRFFAQRVVLKKIEARTSSLG